MKFASFVSHLALFTAMVGMTPVRAEDTAPPNPNAATEAATAKLTAQAAYTTAQTERLKAQMAALNLPTVAGQTTAGEGAGATEAWMVSAAAINAAAGKIAGDVKNKGPFLLVGKDDTVDLSLADSLRERIEAQSSAATQAKSVYCDGAVRSTSRSVLPVLGAVLGAFKVDTDVQKIEVAPNDAALVNALASQLTGEVVIVPSEVLAPPGGGGPPGSVMAAWKGLGNARQALAVCRTSLAGKRETEALKAQIAEIDGQLAEIHTFASEVTSPGAGKSSLLNQARQIEALPSGAKVLRVHVEHAGGSLIKRTNVLTAFGYPALAVTGGLVVSYRLTDPRTGGVVASSLLVCRTGRSRLGEVQEGKVNVAGCGLTTYASPEDRARERRARR